jgi:hypothetical protein
MISRRANIAALAFVTSLFTAAPAFSHHAFLAVFDRSKPVTIHGTVTKVEWTNPHARFYIDQKDNSGKVVNWELELGSPNVLMREGWNRYSIRQGDQLTVNGYLARDGSHFASARTVQFPDGRRVFGGSSLDGGPTQ